MSHCYIGIENLNLNVTQRTTLINGLKQLGDNLNPQPCHRNHWRIRLDNQAVIFEALFEDDTISIQAVKNWLANIFGVAVGTISHSVNNQSFAGGSTPVVTFTRTGTNYLRLAQFGGVGATWEQSRQEVLGYLALNRAAWETEAI